jgi:hypothetical protein
MQEQLAKCRSDRVLVLEYYAIMQHGHFATGRGACRLESSMLREKQLFARMTPAGGIPVQSATLPHTTSVFPFRAERLLGKEVNKGTHSTAWN